MPGNTRDYLTIGLLTLVVAVSALDLWSDYGQGVSVSHFLQEGVLMAAGLVGLAWIVWDLRRQAHRIQWLEHELAAARKRADRRGPELEDARRRLGAVIDAQFRAWGLTESERAVGWLLLKGLSVREVAAMRGTHDKTVRQQASAIYRKADLPGRHAFVAWFIEDLL